MTDVFAKMIHETTLHGITKNLHQLCDSLARLVTLSTIDLAGPDGERIRKEPEKYLIAKLDEYLEVLKKSALGTQPGDRALEKAIGNSVAAICEKVLADLKTGLTVKQEEPRVNLKCDRCSHRWNTPYHTTIMCPKCEEGLGFTEKEKEVV